MTIVLVTGCSNKKELDGYEHYDLKGKDTTSYYSYIDEENNRISEYIITDITPEKSEVLIQGLFFRVGKDDYILLDKIETCNDNQNSYADKLSTRFYDKKLYINRCFGTVALEYTLDGEKITKVDIASKLEKPLSLSSIEDIDENYIYYKGKEHYADEYQSIRCSRKNYKCEIIEN